MEIKKAIRKSLKEGKISSATTWEEIKKTANIRCEHIDRSIRILKDSSESKLWEPVKISDMISLLEVLRDDVFEMTLRIEFLEKDRTEPHYKTCEKKNCRKINVIWTKAQTDEARRRGQLLFEKVNHAKELK